MLKKLLCGIAAIIIFSSTAFAENIIFREIEQPTSPSSVFSDGFIAECAEMDIDAPEKIELFSVPDKPVEEFLSEHIKLRTEELNTSAYNLSIEEFATKFYNTIFSDCLLPVEPRFYYALENDIVTDIKIIYLFDSEAKDFAAYRKLNLLINEIYNYASAGKTPLEKALFAYQKIVYECDYDPNPVTDGSGNKAYKTISHTAYGFTENGYAVCQGYSLLYGEVLRRLGIQSTVVTCQTDEINHMWNYVKLGDDWYHSDVTNAKMYYGDSEIACGYNDMRYFLRSDGIENHGQKAYWNIYDSDTLPECNSTEYENGYMFNNNQAMIYRINGMLSFDVYSVSNNKISVIPFSSSKLKTVVFFTDIKNRENTTYNRYMYSLKGFTDAHLVYTKYNGNKMTGCTIMKTGITPNALYMMQQNIPVPAIGSSDKFMLWDSDMATPLAECAEAKASE